MALTDLAIRLLVLFYPGIVCFLIVEALTVHQERKTHEVIFFTFLYGMLSYLIYGLIAYASCIRCSAQDGVYLAPFEISFFGSLTGEPKAVPSGGDKADANPTGPSSVHRQLDFLEILWVTLCAIALALVWSWGDQKKLLHWFARTLHVSRKLGEPVWTAAFSAPDHKWWVVRDLNRKLMFQVYVGWISDVEETTHLVVSNVI